MQHDQVWGLHWSHLNPQPWIGKMTVSEKACPTNRSRDKPSVTCSQSTVAIHQFFFSKLRVAWVASIPLPPTKNLIWDLSWLSSEYVCGVSDLLNPSFQQSFSLVAYIRYNTFILFIGDMYIYIYMCVCTCVYICIRIYMILSVNHY